jgi:hypothetical protein
MAERDALLDGGVWREFCARLADVGARVLGDAVPDSPQVRAEGYRYLAQQLADAVWTVLGNSDPERPHLDLLADRVRKWGTLCSDAKAHATPVRDDRSYTIRGTRGSAHYLSFQVMAGEAGVAYLDQGGLRVEPDGSFELRLSARPSPGNWLRLPPGSSRLIVRQYFCDWEREQAARVVIEPDDGVEPPPAPTPESVGRELEAIAARFAVHSAALLEAGARPDEPNVLRPPLSMEAQAGAPRTWYGLGYFRIAPGDALILELEPPEAHYWSFQLGNFWHEELDYENHASSLNGRQAAIDADGLCRIVISLADPGIANWLDPVGRREGRIVFRCQDAAGCPAPRLRRVAFADLARELPAGTARLDASARRAQIRARRRHVAWRFA